ncbi:MAG: OmpH family outer membrane protein [Bacteroidaceae bacterium]|nr:OmpH family outer membrane protein [Bacteroidaceae bacterium]
MKKHFISFILLAAPLFISAQEVTELPVAPTDSTAETTAEPKLQFGYLSYNSVYEKLPEYAEAQKQFEALKAKYEAEAKRSENEFQKKFAEFLQGQKDFPASIMQKRQVELQELMEKSISFRRESRSLLKKAEADMQKPVLARLNAVISSIAAEQGLQFVINTDGNTLPFVSSAVGVDITDAVLDKLNIQ